MKDVVYISMEDCPYCRTADIVISELIKENEEYGCIRIKRLEDMSPEAQQYGRDYYYVPSMFVDGTKIYEAHPGETIDECRKMVEKAFRAALMY